MDVTQLVAMLFCRDDDKMLRIRERGALDETGLTTSGGAT